MPALITVSLHYTSHYVTSTDASIVRPMDEISLLEVQRYLFWIYIKKH